MEYEKKQKIKFICFVIFIYLVCAFLMTLGLVHYFDDHETKEAIKRGVIVQAEYVKVIPHYRSGGFGGWRGSEYFNVSYEYIDKTGVKYEGEVGIFETREEAESYIGKKVDIYICDNGHSIPVFEADDFNENYAWWLMGIAIGIAISYTIGLIIWSVVKHRRKKRDENEFAPSDTV